MAENDQTLPAAELERIRNARSDPRPTQPDFLHLRVLRDDIAAELRRVPAAPNGLDVLDVFCGTRPYEDLLPPGSRSTGLDIDNRYGAADVISDEFLPFEDASFDLVTCFEAFHYLPDPAAGVAEIRRVLRPDGWALLTVPLVWEYDRTQLEHRFTGPELEALFEGWAEVRLIENGGRGVAWASQTGHLAHLLQLRIMARLGPAASVLRPLFALTYRVVNFLGAAADRRLGESAMTLPMNLMVAARRR